MERSLVWKWIDPVRRGSSPVIPLISVVLPEPLGPISASISEALTSNEMFFRMSGLVP